MLLYAGARGRLEKCDQRKALNSELRVTHQHKYWFTPGIDAYRPRTSVHRTGHRLVRITGPSPNPDHLIRHMAHVNRESSQRTLGCRRPLTAASPIHALYVYDMDSGSYL